MAQHKLLTITVDTNTIEVTYEAPNDQTTLVHAKDITDIRINGIASSDTKKFVDAALQIREDALLKSDTRDQIICQFISSLKHFTRDHVPRRNDLMSLESDRCHPNGCTLSPDFNFGECCNKHDEAYCRGGSKEDKNKADKELYNCIESNTNSYLAWIYFQAVQLLGDSYFGKTSTTVGSE